MIGITLKNSLLAAAGLVQLFATPATSASLPGLAPRDSDPFYTPPSGWANQNPGTILKSRQISNPPYIQYASNNLRCTWQFLLRSNDQDNNAVPVVTTVFVPQNSERGKSDRLYTYLIPYDTPYNLASPSYGATNDTLKAPEGIIISFALNKGWYVTVPDYESTLGGFGNGPLSGKATLDSIRATLSSNSQTGISRGSWTVLQGSSGGAIAGEWAAELQSDYAGDLAYNIVGYALSGLTPYIGNVYRKLDGQISAGLLVSVVLGISNTVKDFSNWLYYGLVSSTASEFRSAQTLNNADTINKFINKNISAYFNQGPKWVEDKIPHDTLYRVGNMGLNYKNPPPVPMYFAKGQKDQISDYADTLYLYNLYCSGNIRSLTFNVSTNLAHIESSYFAFPGIAKFIQDRFNGVTPQSGCRQVTVNKPTSYEAWDATVVPQAYLDNLYNYWKNNVPAGF